MLEHVEKEMKRLRKNILPQMLSYLFHDVSGDVKLLHINIGNFKKENGRYEKWSHISRWKHNISELNSFRT